MKSDVCGIDGTQTDWEELQQVENQRDDYNNHLELTWQLFSRMIVAYYLEEYEIADRLSKEFNTITAGNKSSAYVFISLGTYFSGLINLALYRKTGRKKFKCRAQTYTKKLAKTVKDGSNNNAHKLHLLEAECWACFKSHGQTNIKKKYDEAIADSAAMGCINDQALACELAGEYFLRNKDIFRCRKYFAKAISLYKEWGAVKKVDLLLEKRKTLIQINRVKRSSSFTQKSKLDQVIYEMEDESDFICQKVGGGIHQQVVELDDLGGSSSLSNMSTIEEQHTYNDESNKKETRWSNSDGSPKNKKSTTFPKTPPRMPARCSSYCPPTLPQNMDELSFFF